VASKKPFFVMIIPFPNFPILPVFLPAQSSADNHRRREFRGFRPVKGRFPERVAFLPRPKIASIFPIFVALAGWPAAKTGYFLSAATTIRQRSISR
jgi:hypothetical protein